MHILNEKRVLEVKKKLASFGDFTLPDAVTDPKKAWIFVANKINTWKASDHETKFVSLAAIANLIAACLQLVVGLSMKSVSVVSAAIDSLLDFLLGLFNLFLLKESQKEEDESYNFGYGKLQGFGALFQGIVILFFGASLAYFSILKLLENAPIEGIGMLILVMIVDFLGGVMSVGYYHLYIKKTENMIVIGTLKKVYAGLLFNIGIMSGLVLIWAGMRYFDQQWFFIDAVVGLIVAGYVLYTSAQLLMGGYGMLMDKSLDDEEIKQIEEVINTYHKKYVRWDDLRTRRSGTQKHIQFNVYFEPTTTSFHEIYGVCVFLKEHIQQEISGSTVLITPLPAESTSTK